MLQSNAPVLEKSWRRRTAERHRCGCTERRKDHWSEA